jgi:Amt family ammonium transporter
MEAFWIVLLATAALLVRIGQMIGAMGFARAKNSASAGFRSLADLCLATLCFWAVGAAIYFQTTNGIFGIQPDALIGWRGLPLGWFAMLALILIATATIAPAVAERSKFSVPMSVSALLAGFLVPLIAHWSWAGWLGKLGFTDFAGAAAIHLAPAACAATAAAFVGPRDGKYNRDGSSNMIPGHSLTMILLAVLLTVIGWVPYMLSVAAMRTLQADADKIGAQVFIAAAAGGLGSLIVGRLRYGKADVPLTLCGVLGGLVSITAASEIGTPAAFLIGFIAGLIVPIATIYLDTRFKIDDPAGVIAIHGVGAIWALLAAALFSPLDWSDRFQVLAMQILGVIVVIAVSAILTTVLMFALKATTGLRAKESEEFEGLDLAEHDINAHPDFQQTTIKSYHLRET